MRLGSVAIAGATASLALTGASVDAQQLKPPVSAAPAETRDPPRPTAPEPGAPTVDDPLAPHVRSAPSASGAVIGDVELGMADAPVVIVEYASLTCAACQHFQAEILPQLNARYILSGQAKFILRDYPTPPAPLAFAGFALARCGGRERYYELVRDLFSRQTDLLAAARAGAAKRVILDVAGQHGIAASDVDACLSDKGLHAFIERQIDEAPLLTTTPAVFVNGRSIQGFTFDAVAAAIEAALEAERVAAARAAAARVAAEANAGKSAPPDGPVAASSAPRRADDARPSAPTTDLRAPSSIALDAAAPPPGPRPER